MNHLDEVSEILKTKKKTIFKVKGNSMSPLIKEGQKITVRPIPEISQLKRFDLILYKAKDQFVCHYYWGINFGDEELITRPLNPLGTFDFPICKKQLIGKVSDVHINLLLKCKIFWNDFWK